MHATAEGGRLIRRLIGALFDGRRRGRLIGVERRPQETRRRQLPSCVADRRRPARHRAHALGTGLSVPSPPGAGGGSHQRGDTPPGGHTGGGGGGGGGGGAHCPGRAQYACVGLMYRHQWPIVAWHVISTFRTACMRIVTRIYWMLLF